ncbi:hypothetical protein [Vibrio furnissii]|uniref:hypothetical protein n=1 Tax=Vibrio furnissii TaxID=29494 RepID=UPI001EEAA16F|nr:hypothetical protein [Vibrio furnissii]MCG6268621.1 hypothetical protein [Vibrio furnissii]
MNYFKLIISTILMLYSTSILAANNEEVKGGSFVGSLVSAFQIDEETYKELNPYTKIPYENAAYEFCNQTTSYESTTYQHTAPKGIAYVCKEDLPASIIITAFGRSSVDSLVDPNGMFYNTMKSIGITDLSFQTKDMSETISIFQAFASGIITFFQILWIFLVGAFIKKIVDSYKDDFASSVWFTLKSNIKKIAVLIFSFCVLFTAFGPLTFSVAIATMNKYKTFFDDNTTNIGALTDSSSAVMAVEAQMPMINSNLEVMALETQQTLQNMIGNSVRHHYYMDKNWSIFNYDKDDITHNMALEYVDAVLNSIQFEADLDNSLFSDLVQVETNCLRIFDTYKSMNLDIVLPFKDENVFKCVSLGDKTDYKKYIKDADWLASLLDGSYIDAAKNVNKQFKILNPLADANEAGLEFARKYVAKPEKILNIAKEALNSNSSFKDLASYESLVQEAKNSASVFKDIDASDISPKGQKKFNSVVLTSFKDSATFGAVDLEYGDEYGLKQDNVLNMWLYSVFKKGYRETRKIECSKVNDPENASKWRSVSADIVNGDDWRGVAYERYCTEIVKNKVVALGAKNELELFESKQNRKAYYLFFEIYQSLVMDSAMLAYNDYVQDKDIAKDFVDHQKMGAISYWLNISEKRTNNDNFSEVRDTVTGFMPTIDRYNYEVGTKYNFVIDELTPNYKNSLYSINGDYALTPSAITEKKNVEENSKEASDSIIKSAIDGIFASQEIECINDSAIFGEGFCRDETYYLVQQYAEKSITTGINIIIANAVFQMGDVLLDATSDYFKWGSWVGLLVEALLNFAVGLGAVIMPFFALIAWIKIIISIACLLSVGLTAIWFIVQIILMFLEIIINCFTAITVNIILSFFADDADQVYKHSFTMIFGRFANIPLFALFVFFIYRAILPELNAFTMYQFKDALTLDSDNMMLYGFMKAINSTFDSFIILFLCVIAITILFSMKVMLEKALGLTEIKGIGVMEAMALAAPARKAAGIAESNLVGDKATQNYRSAASKIMPDRKRPEPQDKDQKMPDSAPVSSPNDRKDEPLDDGKPDTKKDSKDDSKDDTKDESKKSKTENVDDSKDLTEPTDEKTQTGKENPENKSE